VTVNERVRAAIEPWLASRDLELFDVEHGAGLLRVLVDRAGGVDLEALAEATRAISVILDDVDPIPGRYTLEVSTPGLERPLRTPTHFAGAVGTKVTVKTSSGEERRVAGTLTAADQGGITLTTEAGERRLGYDEIEKARTVFEWGPAPKPGKGTSRTKKKAATK